MTTEQDLEIIRLNMRLLVLRGIVGGVIGALQRVSPPICTAIIEGLEADLANNPDFPVADTNAAQSDLISSEWREAREEMLSYLRQHVTKA